MWVIRSRAWQALVAGALGIRLAVVELTRGYIPKHDDRSYLRHAIALERTGAYPVYHVAGHVVPTAYRAPAFPLMLALAHGVVGGGVEHERIAQALVGTLLVGLVGVVSAEIWPLRTALVATALAAVSPVLVVFGASLISEPLFAALELGAVACALRAHGRARWALAAGALAGAAALTRPEGLAVALGVALCAGGRRAAALVLVAAALCVAPWTVRNALVLHAFVPVSTEAGNTLAGTYNSVSARTGALWRDPRAADLYRAARAAHRGDEAGTDRALLGAVAHWVAHHPLYPARVAFENGRRLAGLAPTSFSADSLHVVSLPESPAPAIRLGLLVASALALAGACTAAARRAPPGWWLAGLVVTLAAVLVNAEQRFAVPLQAWLAPLGALALTRGG